MSKSSKFASRKWGKTGMEITVLLLVIGDVFKLCAFNVKILGR